MYVLYYYFSWLANDEIKKLIRVLTAHDHKFYFVGGCVRDSLKGNSADVNDFDLSSNWTIDVLYRWCSEQNLQLLTNYMQYGSLTILLHNQQFTVTSFRQDINPQGRHSAICYTGKMYEDSCRRDFTINALYYDPLNYHIYDYHHGVEHLLNNKLIFIGNAEVRIQEDYLRILRYLRFYLKLTPWKFNDNAATWHIFAKYQAHLQQLSPQLLYSELKQIILAKNVDYFLQIIANYKLLIDILPIKEDIVLDITALLHTKAELEYRLNFNFQFDNFILILSYVCGQVASLVYVIHRKKEYCLLEAIAKCAFELEHISDYEWCLIVNLLDIFDTQVVYYALYIQYFTQYSLNKPVASVLQCINDIIKWHNFVLPITNLQLIELGVMKQKLKWVKKELSLRVWRYDQVSVALCLQELANIDY